MLAIAMLLKMLKKAAPAPLKVQLSVREATQAPLKVRPLDICEAKRLTRLGRDGKLAA